MFFRNAFLVLFTLLCSLSPALAQQETPLSNPNEVIVKGRKVSHSWRQGRIWVPAAELQPLLNLRSDEPDVDLLKALGAKGDYLWQTVDGRFVAKRDPSKFSTASAPRRGPVAKASRTSQTNPTQEPDQSGKLYYAVQEFNADTGFVRAYIGVVNKGPGPSDPSEMVCQFTDGFGKAYAEDKRSIPSMKPGETEVYEIFSMVKTEDTSMKVTKENVTCYFLSQTNPAANPTTRKEWRQQARERKL